MSGRLEREEAVVSGSSSFGVAMDALCMSIATALGIYIYHTRDVQQGGRGVPIIGPFMVTIVQKVTGTGPTRGRAEPVTPPPSPRTETMKTPTPSVLLKRLDEQKAQAWVTLATNDRYAIGALVVASSLRQAATQKQTHCMITDGVTQGMRQTLHEIFDQVTIVNVLDSNDEQNLLLLNRPDLGITFTKLNCWRLLQYRKCVFLDADTLVLQNCDELFDHDQLAAVPDVGWPDMFNSGVFVFTPSIHTYQALVDCAKTQGSFDGGDQGLLNTFFSDWKRLSFIYNCTSQAAYSYAAAYNKFGKNVKIIHFIGADKPWHHTYSPSTGVQYKTQSQHQRCHLEQWWQVFTSNVQHRMNPELCNSLLNMSLPVSQGSDEPARKSSSEDAIPPAERSPTPEEDKRHQEKWEAGFADYKGKDAFQNIQKRLDKKIDKKYY